MYLNASLIFGINPAIGTDKFGGRGATSGGCPSESSINREGIIKVVFTPLTSS